MAKFFVLRKLPPASKNCQSDVNSKAFYLLNWTFVTTISILQKVKSEIEAMFNATVEMAEKVYEHRVVKAIGQM